MSHKEQRQFCERMRELFPYHFSKVVVLDAGSRNINGCNRGLFTDCQYVGADIVEGDNVDVVGLIHELTYDDGYFDTIISTEMLEHDIFWDKSLMNMVRMLRDGGLRAGGLMVLTCATSGRAPHCPVKEFGDYYQNRTEDDLRRLEGFLESFDRYVIRTNEQSHDLQFWGVKK